MNPEMPEEWISLGQGSWDRAAASDSALTEAQRVGGEDPLGTAGSYQSFNPFPRAAAFISVATARMASPQTVPWRGQLAVLPSGRQLPTLLPRGSKAPTKAITQT